MSELHPAHLHAIDAVLIGAGAHLIAQMQREIGFGQKRLPVTEEEHQWAIFRFLDRLAVIAPDRAPEIEDIFASSGGGRRHKGAAGRLKGIGVRNGIPDIEAWLPRIRVDGSICHGLVIELKRPMASGKKAGVASPQQKARIARLLARGYAAHIIHGWVPACETLLRHLALPSAPGPTNSMLDR